MSEFTRSARRISPLLLVLCCAANTSTPANDDHHFPAKKAVPAGIAPKPGKPSDDKTAHDKTASESPAPESDKPQASSAPHADNSAHASGAHGSTVHWEYGTGEHGAAHWGELDPAWEKCGEGKLQSPIDISKTHKLPLPELEFNYKPGQLAVLNNGHTLQSNMPSGSSLTVAGERYTLVQFHFHAPSEETLDGHHADMVVHLVHKNAPGQLAVVAVLMNWGLANPLLDKVFANAPRAAGVERIPAGISIDPTELLPSERSYYTFAGSLTTPPCSEGVTWFVLKNPRTLSRQQLDAFTDLFGDNARPVQPLNGRVVRESLP